MRRQTTVSDGWNRKETHLKKSPLAKATLFAIPRIWAFLFPRVGKLN